MQAAVAADTQNTKCKSPYFLLLAILLPWGQRSHKSIHIWKHRHRGRQTWLKLVPFFLALNFNRHKTARPIAHGAVTRGHNKGGRMPPGGDHRAAAGGCARACCTAYRSRSGPPSGGCWSGCGWCCGFWLVHPYLGGRRGRCWCLWPARGPLSWWSECGWRRSFYELACLLLGGRLGTICSLWLAWVPLPFVIGT